MRIDIGDGRVADIGRDIRGAKTAMTVALRSPDSCANIIAVDNAPVDAALASDFPTFVRGMQKVEGAGVTTQKEADKILEPFAKVRLNL